ncbi:CIC11C00000004006 [Sungouiella intermedia]|uniref:CIC11C00000004006 n=1 Tax=Sungouiella intermedia TaxID=45354 RepID=A0A1L0B7F7_9ASCO|nr:CIC11C00000004006 [[Candida] intermedia]
MSYLYIKNFIEEQIRILNQPLVIDDELRAVMSKNNISEETMKSILLKANLRLKRHNRDRFNRQAVHQIVQQIVNNEKEKVFKVNEALAKIEIMIQPILLPDFSLVGDVGDRVGMFNELVKELPQPEYLFAAHSFSMETEQEDPEVIESGGKKDETETETEDGKEGEEANLLVQDDQERFQENRNDEEREGLVKKYQVEVAQELKDHISSHQQKIDTLKEQYTQLRALLIEMNEELVYKMQKFEYLRQLNGKMNFLQKDSNSLRPDSEDEDSDEEVANTDLKIQMGRFRILMEKLEFAMK